MSLTYFHIRPERVWEDSVKLHGLQMNALVFSDMHIYPYSQFAKIVAEGVNSRLDECLSVLEQLVLFASLPLYDFVVIAGDVFNEKDKVNVRAFTETIVLLSQICNKPVLMVTGNHDFVAKKHGSVGYSALTILKELNESSMFFLDQDVEIKGQKFVCVPYFENAARAIEEIERRAPHPEEVILITHAEVKGAKDGDFEFQTGITKEFLSLFKAAIVGHCHQPQTFENILIPGSPLHHDFGDIGREAYAWTMQIDKDVSFIPREISGPRFYEVRSEEYHPEMAGPQKYFRVIGELNPVPENASIVPCVNEVEGTGRGEVLLSDSKEELLRKWLRFKGLSQTEIESYMPYGEACLADEPEG